MSDIITNYKITDRPPSPDDYEWAVSPGENSSSFGNGCDFTLAGVGGNAPI